MGRRGKERAFEREKNTVRESVKKQKGRKREQTTKERGEERGGERRANKTVSFWGLFGVFGFVGSGCVWCVVV